MLTDNEIALVRASFARVVPIQSAATDARHSGYGVTTEHYRLVGEALLWTSSADSVKDFAALRSQAAFYVSDAPYARADGRRQLAWRPDGRTSSRGHSINARAVLAALSTHDVRHAETKERMRPRLRHWLLTWIRHVLPARIIAALAQRSYRC
jgi:hypothetical protein